ncbi:hypothetical protein L9F63_006879, partial [Diploptera punctata]
SPFGWSITICGQLIAYLHNSSRWTARNFFMGLKRQTSDATVQLLVCIVSRLEALG